MKSQFPVSSTLEIVIEDDGRCDPTGILSLVLFGEDKKPIQSSPILPTEVPELVKALVSAALALEQKGLTLTTYNAGYEDAKEGRPPEVKPEWPRV